jgi:hypothetical protein
MAFPIPRRNISDPEKYPKMVYFGQKNIASSIARNSFKKKALWSSLYLDAIFLPLKSIRFLE